MSFPLLRFLCRRSVIEVRVDLLLATALSQHRLAASFALCSNRIRVVHMLGTCGQIVRGSNLSALPLMIGRALLLFLLVCVCPVCETAVARLFTNFGVELRVRVRHARDALVFRGFGALEHDQLLV